MFRRKRKGLKGKREGNVGRQRDKSSPHAYPAFHSPRGAYLRVMANGSIRSSKMNSFLVPLFDTGSETLSVAK